MARKSRVPPPPRPVQASRTRLEERRRNWRPLLVVALGSRGEAAFDAFVGAYRFKGPEWLPPEALQPGS